MYADFAKDFRSTIHGLDGRQEIETLLEENGRIIDGVVKTGFNRWYPIIDGVPVLLMDGMEPDCTNFVAKYNLEGTPLDRSSERELTNAEQSATNVTFSDKWRKFKNYGMEPQHQEFLYDWYTKKLGVPNVDALKAFYKSKTRILECGPGSGFNSRFMAQNCSGTVTALDISEAAFTTFGNIKDLDNCNAINCDLMHVPFEDETFDFVIADGVLHHTPNTRAAVEALIKKVKPGGQFFFYVYRRMGALRYYADQYIREHFTKLEPEECYKACEGITDLGRELSRLDAKITLDKPIEVLGIPAGTHDVQRLVYYSVMKCFWNEAFDYETNNMVNFDWYHPHNAWQHTDEEVEGWLKDAGVKDWQFNDSNPNGISVLLTK